MDRTLLFFGDSITAGSRTDAAPLGIGFVKLLADKYKQTSVKVINSGVNGCTIQDLLARYQQDVIPFQPDLMVIMIGINDAFNAYHQLPGSTNCTSFEADYKQLIDLLLKQLPHCKLILVTPYLITADHADGLYQAMAQYVDAVEELAKYLNLPVLNTQHIFDTVLNLTPGRQLADDKIHPYPAGHALLAAAIHKLLKTLLFD